MPTSFKFFESSIPTHTLAQATAPAVPPPAPAVAAPVPAVVAPAPAALNDYVLYASLPIPGGGCSI